MVMSSVSPSSPTAATWRDYLLLTKPRVISLLLFTTLMAMFIAKGGWPGFWLFVGVFVGGYMSAGSANAFNMVVDRDIDSKMVRTSKRPTVTAKIPIRRVFLFATVLGVASFLILWASANLLTAVLSLAGLGWYVLIYTLYMKRRFWNNIVLGGAAGAFPPLVGWAAVTGSLSLFAWYLFFIVFFWTPVHFWALAIMIKADYQKVGIPMLPVVHGDERTVRQIWLYALLTVAITIVPFAMGELKWLYLVAWLLLSGVLLQRSRQLTRKIDRPTTVSLYKYSMLYLALLFVAMAFDRAIFR